MKNMCDDHTWIGEGDCPHCEAAWGGMFQPATQEVNVMKTAPQSSSQYPYQVIFIHRESGGYVQFNDVYALCGEDAVRFSRNKLAEPDKYVFVGLTGEILSNRRDY